MKEQSTENIKQCLFSDQLSFLCRWWIILTNFEIFQQQKIASWNKYFHHHLTSETHCMSIASDENCNYLILGQTLEPMACVSIVARVEMFWAHRILSVPQKLKLWNTKSLWESKFSFMKILFQHHSKTIFENMFLFHFFTLGQLKPIYWY